MSRAEKPIDPDQAVAAVRRARARSRAQGYARMILAERHPEEYRALYKEGLTMFEEKTEEKGNG